ncbi:MAG: heavy metal-binding domain-containing protein [Bacteroidota bacterium]
MSDTKTPTDLPAHAGERLNLLRGCFTSDLSVNEFLLVKEAGFEPLGMVVGSSIYHTGYQARQWSKNEEMVVLTQAMYHARELAMERMEEEAKMLGADGVVGVRLETKHLGFGEHLMEFVAIGTAVRATDTSISYRAVGDRPFTSDLSGQDFWTLLKAGYRPVGLVMGNCVFHVSHQTIGQWFSNAGQNTEMVNFTQALYEARELAMERMQMEARTLEAAGIVGVQLHEGSYQWHSHVIEFFSIGTAIVPIRENHHIPAPQLVLSLNT